MKIDKATMSGFRGATAPVEVAFDTSKSVTLIFGENGTGKSTIADAFDFLCNGSYGSLEGYSLGEPRKKYVPSLGAAPSIVKVTLTSGSSTWVATLGKDGPVVLPTSGYPDARILRRKAILRLIETQPKQRFEELKAFIAVPNIDKSEAALREAVNRTQERFNEYTRAWTQAKDALDGLWTKEGKPNTDSLAWAKAEAGKDVTELRKNVQEIEKIERSLSSAEIALSSLDRSRDDQKNAEAALADAERKQQEGEKGQTQQNAELLKLLQDARTYIEPREALSECPVCEQGIKRADLVRRLGNRIDEMRDLNSLVQATARAKRDLEAKISVASQAQKEFCAKLKELGHLIQPDPFPEVQVLNLNWEKFEDLMSHRDASGAIEQQGRELLSASLGCRAPLRTRRDTDQKSINQHNAIKGNMETLEGKQSRAISEERLLKTLSTTLEIVSKERKDYVEGILARISGEVERLYTTVHPGEGIGKIRFYLKPNTIGSLEFAGNFQNIVDVPPQAYYSESHLDTLGICVFLGLAKFFKTDKTIVILDDVLTSVDGPHLDRFMGLLYDEAREFMQFIVTTHYRPWRDRYRWAKGPVANTQLIELGPWTLQNGLHVGEFLSAVAELRAVLQGPKFDRQIAASKAGIVLESLLDFVTLKYRCPVPRKARDEYTLGDLAYGIDSKLGKELRSRKAPVKGDPKSDTPLRPVIDAATTQHWVRNAVGCHFSSLGSEVTDGEVRAFCEKVSSLAESLICLICQSLPTRRPSGSYWQCRCGELELYPLIYPGADPATVDDEG